MDNNPLKNVGTFSSKVLSILLNSVNLLYHFQSKFLCARAIIFQGLIDCEIRTTVEIIWSFAQMCCAISLACPSIATHRTCQFWARSEPVNMPKTIESSAKCGVHAVIRRLYSEQATRNVFLRYCPSWQCSAVYCSYNKEAPEAFSMGSVWSPTIICPNLAPCFFFSSLSSFETVVGGHILAQWTADQRRELTEITDDWFLWRGYWKIGMYICMYISGFRARQHLRSLAPVMNDDGW